MNDDVEKLRKILKETEENNDQLPARMDAFMFIRELMENIGSISSDLRETICDLMYTIIGGKNLKAEENKTILWELLSDSHLFFGIGKMEDDSVFTRAFTILYIGVLIAVNTKSEPKFLNDEEVGCVLDNVLKYIDAEKDFRGYVDEKGWAHTAAHTADTLESLAESSIQKEGLGLILKAIKDLACIPSTAYSHEEPERLVSAVVAVLQREILPKEEIVNWLSTFEEEKAYDYANIEHFNSRVNQKQFLRDLYFRVKDSEKFSYLSAVIDEAQNAQTRPFAKALK